MKINSKIIKIEYEGKDYSRTEGNNTVTWTGQVHGIQYQLTYTSGWQHTYDNGLSWLNCTDTPIIEKEYQRKINAT